MNTSAAIADREAKIHFGSFSSRQDHVNGARPRKRGDDVPLGGQARRSLPRRTIQVRLGSSRLRVPVSQRDCAISSLDWTRDPEQVEGQRTVMNHVG